ncbi:MAG: PHP domain-containing protein [Candidatus Sigynarchaeota archaeon]
MIKRFPKAHVLLVIAGAMVAAWIVMLAVLFAIPTGEATFTDVITGNDVSAEYSIEMSAWRYMLEPFSAFTFTAAANPIGVLVLVSTLYIVARVVFLLIEKVVLRVNGKLNRKVEIVMEHARHVVNFFWKYALMAVGIGALVVLIAYITTGFQPVNNYFMGGILIIAWTLVGALGLKVMYSLATLLVHKFTFRVKIRKAWKDLPRTSWRYWAHKIPDVLGREPRYFLSIGLMFLAITYALESVPLPTRRIVATLGPNEYLFDFHVHTWYSDGSLSPEARVDWYIQQGISGAAFTDHDNIRGWSRAMAYVEQNRLPFTVIKGEEYTRHDDTPIHLNIFGIDFAIAPEDQASLGYSDTLYLNVSDMIATVKANNGFVVVNHYTGWPGWPYTFDQLRDWGVDGFEVVNGGQVYPLSIRDYCIANGLACIAGSDEHMNGEVPSFVRVTLNDPSNVTEIFTTLKANTHDVVVIEPKEEVFPIYVEWGDDDRKYLNGFAAFGNYFASMDAGQLASWIAWSCAAYVAFAALVMKVKKTPLETMEAQLVVDPRKRCLLLKLAPSYRKLMQDTRPGKSSTVSA